MKTLAVVLLRERTVAAIRRFVNDLVTRPWFRDQEGVAPLERLWERLDQTVRWREHSSGFWCLHGSPRSGVVLNDRNKPHDLESIEGLLPDCSWAVVPWGADYTGLMLVLLIAEGGGLASPLAIVDDDGLADLVVSCYGADEVHAKRFRGAVIERRPEDRARGLWKCVAGSGHPILVNRVVGHGEDLRVPGSVAEIVAVSEGLRLGGLRVRQGWLRITDEADLLEYTGHDGTNILVAPDLNLGAAHESMRDVDGMVEDSLRFGVRALKSASWVFIPATERLKAEIFLGNDPAATSRFVDAVEGGGFPDFSYRCFC